MANRMRELRRKKDMTQEEVASILGVSKAAVSAWEQGRNGISRNYADKLCQIYETDYDYLMGEGLDEIHAHRMIGSTGASSHDVSLAMSLERVVSLYSQGLLTDDEFTLAKRKILEG